MPSLLARVEHAKLQLVPAIVDDQGVEQPQRIHADQYRRLIRQPPLLEYVQIAERHAGIMNGNGAQTYGGRRHQFAPLNILGGTNDGVGFTPRRSADARQRFFQRKIRDGDLPTGIDDRLAAYLTHESIHHHQGTAQRVERHADEPGTGALISRIRNIDSIMTEIDEDSLADQAFGAEHPFSATQG